MLIKLYKINNFVKKLKQKLLIHIQIAKKQYFLDQNKDIQKIERLIHLLSTDTNDRTIEICQQIAKDLQGFSFFDQYQHLDIFLDICQYIYIHQFIKGQYVYKQGDNSDAFYIVLQGSVSIYIDEPTQYKNFIQLKQIYKLTEGESFGEIGLLFDQKRSQSAITTEDSFLIILEKTVFQKFIKDYQNEHLTEKINFLKNQEIFNQLQQSEIAEPASKLQIQEYSSKQIIISDDKQPQYLYFIKQGRVKVYKKILFKINKQTREKIKDYIKDPTIEEIQNNLFEQEQIEIEELGENNSFGEYQLLYNKQYDFKVITVIPSQIYFINAYDMFKVISQQSLENYKKQLKKYPNSNDIRQMYWQKINWITYQQKIIQNTFKKKDFKNINKKQENVKKSGYLSILMPYNVMDIQDGQDFYSPNNFLVPKYGSFEYEDEFLQKNTQYNQKKYV
ncbi:hypothetical protein IMG5_057730 [Ichthyophthirius multifiliis]|uniref:Cyclic nucleotide-binding domain protein n=1 Tax=Ichthyophthirius multifiliis TaxID=5932 RepID=G0QNE8_ICHMU|nr:hypothetical protein IMG5_057730 [Ichthyophthirius multifiliis]EGR33253.1 hypothetical protein IMG5_057730 [Ichthyophthirius multifiliis]|eukprot:XP_004037239.1 hypothetical protein IMG5_057730 [Ichthyophthirius multifiliis]